MRVWEVLIEKIGGQLVLTTIGERADIGEDLTRLLFRQVAMFTSAFPRMEVFGCHGDRGGNKAWHW